jgi:hypothetical protein
MQFGCLGASIGLFGALSCAVAIAQVAPICALSEDDLVAGFLQAAETRPWLPAPNLVRFPKREAVIGVFHDKSARKPADTVARNLAIFHAMGRSGFLTVIRLAVGFSEPTADIELVFINRTASQSKFKNEPVGVLMSPRSDRCRVLLELAESDATVRLISKAHVFVDDDVGVPDLPDCVADALRRAVGLIKWNRELGAVEDRGATAQIFVAALYELPAAPNMAILKKVLSDKRSAVCSVRE